MMGRSNSRSRVKRIGFVLLSAWLVILVSWAGGEIIVRVFATTYSLAELENGSVLYRSAVFTRHRMEPDRTVLKIRGDRADAVHINRRGFRGPDFSPVKAPGVVRIIFLGGSSVYSHTHGLGRDWPHRVERLLGDRGLDVECINAGVPGHDTADSVGKFFTELWMYKPDYVVLYQAYNDQKDFATVSLDRPYRDIRDPYVPQNDLRTHAQGLDRLLCHSKLYLEIRYRFLNFTYGLEGKRKPVDPSSLHTTLNPQALDQYRFNVQAVCDLARNAGAKTFLCKQGRLVAPGNSPEEMSLFRFDFIGLDHATWVRAFAECDRIIEEVAVGKGATLIDVSARVTGIGEYFHDHIHLSDRGEDVVAGIVADALEQAIRTATDPQ